MIGVVIAVGVIVVLALAGLVVRGRRAATPHVAERPHRVEDHITPIASMPGEAAADTVVPEPQPSSSTRLRQCPRCGRHTVPADRGDVDCSWCGLRWRQPADAAWPDVHLCLWIPPSDRAPVKEKT